MSKNMQTSHSPISNQQRFLTPSSPCPICGGWEHAQRGYGERCCGYLSNDGKYAFCTREEKAGVLPPRDTEPPSYMHQLRGPCKCGGQHGPDLPRIVQRTTRTAKKHLAASDGDFTYDDPRAVAKYHYRDKDSKIIYTVVRYQWPSDDPHKPYEKTFRPFRWEKSEPTPGLVADDQRILYNLPALLQADKNIPVFYPEGEKDVDTLMKLGLLATCNVGGAVKGGGRSRKWNKSYSAVLKGRPVVLLADNDEDGKTHVETISTALKGIASTVRIVRLPNLPPKGDVTDWVESGGTREQLEQIVSQEAVDPSHVDLATAIQTGNKEAIFNQVAHLIELDDLTLARLKLSIRSTFGSTFPMREFEEVLRVERTHQRQAKNRTATALSARDLMKKQFAPVDYVVPGILPVGLIALAGKQKIGKSWLDYMLALAVAIGGLAFGSIPVEQGDVLYLALEDTERRIYDRLQQLLAPGEEIPEGLDYHYEWPRMDADGVAALENWIKSKKNPRLIIIDPWVKARPHVKIQPGMTGYDIDYEALNCLKQLADTYNVCILIQFHLRKANADDPFDELNGTTGVTACADGFLSLKRTRGESDATLWGTGRDFKEDVDLALSFKDGYWRILGNAQAYEFSKASKEVIDVLERVGKPMGAKEIAEYLGKPDGTIRKRLMDMKDRGEVKDTGNGYIPLLSQKENVNLGNGGNAGNGGNGGNGGNALPAVLQSEQQEVTRYPSQQNEVTRVQPHGEQVQEHSVTRVTSVTSMTTLLQESSLSQDATPIPEPFVEPYETLKKRLSRRGNIVWSAGNEDEYLTNETFFSRLKERILDPNSEKREPAIAMMMELLGRPYTVKKQNAG